MSMMMKMELTTKININPDNLMEYYCSLFDNGSDVEL